jgi:hypothetical protein
LDVEAVAFQEQAKGFEDVVLVVSDEDSGMPVIGRRRHARIIRVSVASRRPASLAA